MKRLSIKKIVEETIAAYNVNTRALLSHGSCVYQTPDGKNCAVGRVMKKKYLKQDIPAAFTSRSLARHFKVEKLDDLFLARYKGHPEEFWSELQGLHDRAHNWNDSGISEHGKILADSIILNYK